MGRFLNADALISTGQGVLGNNMFAYCRNNPIVLEDATGTADRACIYAEGRIDDEPWRDHSPGGGGIPRRNYSSYSNYYGEVADKFYTVRLFRVVAKGVGIGAKWLSEAYMRGYNLQQNAQMQEAQLMVDGAMSTYTYLEEIGAVSVAKWGMNSVNAARHGKIAMAYLAAPIPTPIDEYLAVCHAVKAIYHLFMAGEEVF